MSTKWVEDCNPVEFVGSFASRVLHERMESVGVQLTLAAENHGEDAEHIHQLRVSCRRAMAALRAFEPLFKSPPKKLKRWLKRIREAAGPARDLDVLVQRFQGEVENEVSLYAVERLQRERQSAQLEVGRVAQDALPNKFRKVINRNSSLVIYGPIPLVADYGVEAVRAAYEPFIQLAKFDNPTPTELHQLRIAGKRLRYSLEIFHGIFFDEMREEIYPLIEELQERLGTINDHATAQALFQSWLGEMPADELSASVAKRVVKEHKSLQRQRDRFLEWWGTERRDRIDAYFQRYLGLDR